MKIYGIWARIINAKNTHSHKNHTGSGTKYDSEFCYIKNAAVAAKKKWKKYQNRSEKKDETERKTLAFPHLFAFLLVYLCFLLIIRGVGLVGIAIGTFIFILPIKQFSWSSPNARESWPK